MQIAQSVQDRSDTEDEESPESTGTRTGPRTPARAAQITRGVLLSSVKKSGPRQSFDIAKYERVLPRLPSLHLQTAPELEEEEEEDRNELEEIRAVHSVDVDIGGNAGEDEDEVYENNSMTLADILLQAGHQGDASMQLLGEDDLGEDLSDWE